MRLGKWIRIFERTVPIPPAFSASFGLRAGSELHLALMKTQGYTGDAELIVSPIPTSSWHSVCRLSVRLHDKPFALGKALAFLREKKISLLITEAAATFQERAHWDAVCDLQYCPEFAAMRGKPFESYEKAMEALLIQLSSELRHWAAAPANRDVFLSGGDAHAEFSPLTGLNIAAFRCDLTRAQRVAFEFGAVNLPDLTVSDVRNSLALHRADSISIPTHALITGNTEQRYLRLYFIRNVEAFIMAEIELDVRKISGDGLGMLHQVLMALPDSLNILHLTLHRIRLPVDGDRALTKLIGYWPSHSEAELRERELALRARIDTAEVEDIEGNRHSGLAKLTAFSTPDFERPRVFISYSTKVGEAKLAALRNELIANNFDPVVGTELGGRQMLGGDYVTADVLAGALEKIPTCIAFISLHLKRDDFRQSSGRCLVPPWVVAEEVFAFARGIYFLARLREDGVDDPRYNKNTLELVFSSDEEFALRVAELMQRLNQARQDGQFQGALRAARQAQYRRKFPPV